MTDRIELPKKKKIAYKMLGGRAKGDWWQTGVTKALLERGFEIVNGRAEDAQQRYKVEPAHEHKPGNSTCVWHGPYGGKYLNPLMGSSSGAIFAAMLASGFTLEELLAAHNPAICNPKLRPITQKDVFIWKKSSWKRFRGRLKQIAELFDKVPLRRWWMYMSSFYETAGIERYLREEVFGGDDVKFTDLAPDLYILTSEIDYSRQVVFGKKSGDPDPNDRLSTKRYVYRNYASVADAVAASASMPPFFGPYPISDEVGEKTYFADGDLMNPYSTHVAEDDRSDLTIVSAVYQPYKFDERYGSIRDYGWLHVFSQSWDIMMDSRRIEAIEHGRLKKRALEKAEKYLKDKDLNDHIPELHRILSDALGRHLDTDTIYITPENDADLYYMDPFDMEWGTIQKVAEKGYRRASEILDKFDFTF